MCHILSKIRHSIHRHIGGLEIVAYAKRIKEMIHRHIGGLEKKQAKAKAK